MNPFYKSSHKFYIKYKFITCRWIENSKIKPIGIDLFFNRKAIIN